MSSIDDHVKKLLKTSKHGAELEAQLKATFQKGQFTEADTNGAGVTVVNIPSDSITFFSLDAITKELADNAELDEDNKDRLDKYEVMNLKSMQRDIAATDFATQVLFQIITNNGRTLRYRWDIQQKKQTHGLLSVINTAVLDHVHLFGLVMELTQKKIDIRCPGIPCHSISFPVLSSSRLPLSRPQIS